MFLMLWCKYRSIAWGDKQLLNQNSCYRYTSSFDREREEGKRSHQPVQATKSPFGTPVRGSGIHGSMCSGGS